jgi:hypothetical protein
VSWLFFLRGFLAAFFRWRIAAADIVFLMPRPSRASAAACSFFGVSLMVVSERKTKAYSLSNHFGIIFCVDFSRVVCKYLARHDLT